MKVLQIANGYLGSDLYAHLFSALENYSVKNIVYVPIEKKQPEPSYIRECVTISKCFSKSNRILFFPKHRNIIKDIESHFDLNSIDMVHAHTLFSGGYTALQLRWKYGLHYLVAVRGTDINFFFKKMIHLRSAGLQILQEADTIIFLSPAYREKLFSKYVPLSLRQELYKKSLVIPNGIAPLFFQNSPTIKSLPSPIPRLIYVGEINSNKNLELTIQAIKLLLQKRVELRLMVVGPILEERYRSMLQQKFIEYLGPCSQEEIIQCLQKADIFVMPSHKETFGLVYAEAMSQGLPILYTRGQGFDGQFLDGTIGYAVSDTDPKELSTRIEQVLSMYGSLSENCLRLVKKFSWENIAKQYVFLYQNCTRRKGI